MSAPFLGAPPRMCHCPTSKCVRDPTPFWQTIKERTLGAARNLKACHGARRAFKRRKTACYAATPRATTSRRATDTNNELPAILGDEEKEVYVDYVVRLVKE